MIKYAIFNDFKEFKIKDKKIIFDSIIFDIDCYFSTSYFSKDPIISSAKIERGIYPENQMFVSQDKEMVLKLLKKTFDFYIGLYSDCSRKYSIRYKNSLIFYSIYEDKLCYDVFYIVEKDIK